MRKIKFLAIAVLVVLLATLVIKGDSFSKPLIGGQHCGVSNVLAASMSSEPITEWQNYNDPDYGFTVVYPVGWEFKATIDQSLPYSDPLAIVRRLTFIGKEGMIDLDIWLANDLDLTEWLEWYGKTRAPLPVTESNATVAGDQAVAFLENSQTVDMLSIFFGDGKHVYRLWYTVTHNEVGLQVYQHMLDTMILSNREASAAELPEDVLRSAQEAIEESKVVSPLVSTCCGYNSPGNPFPCCQIGGVDRGNCTWWVYYKYGGVPFRGDAGTWYSQVPNYPDWRRGRQPSKWEDNIAWWSGSPGHVAFLPYYTGGTSITISEMLWCTSCGRTRTISVTNPNGYMWTIYTK